MNVYLDNSAIDWIYRNEKNQHDFQIAVQNGYTFMISDYVVFEAGATPNPDKREMLFKIIKSLGIDVNNIFCDPLTMAKNFSIAHSKGKPGAAYAWTKYYLHMRPIIMDPALVRTDDIQRECSARKDMIQKEYYDKSCEIKDRDLYGKEYKQRKWVDFLKNSFLNTNDPKESLDLLRKSINLAPISIEDAIDLILGFPILTYWFVSFSRFLYESYRIAGSSVKPQKKVFIDDSAAVT